MDFDIGIVMVFGDYFNFFVKVVNSVFWYGNVGGWFQCYMSNDLLFVVDIVENVVCMVVLEIVFGDFVVVLVVVQCYYVKIVVNFYVFYCVDVYQCMGDVSIQVVKDWFVKFGRNVIGNNGDFCVDGVVFFFQCVYQFI